MVRYILWMNGRTGPEIRYYVTKQSFALLILEDCLVTKEIKRHIVSIAGRQ